MADAMQAAIAGGTQSERLTQLAALLRQAPPESVENLVAASDLKDLAESLIAAWYTGLTGSAEKNGSGEKTGAKLAPYVISHEEALAWRATGYAKAPGTCGLFGEWAVKPGLAETASETTPGEINARGNR